MSLEQTPTDLPSPVAIASKPASGSSPDPLSSFRDWFKFEGRRYRIFKREKTKDAPWYLYFERDGRRILRCLDSTAKEVAIINARRIVQHVKSGHWSAADVLRMRQSAPSLCRLLGAYRQNPEGIKPRSIAGNISALSLILRAVHGPKADLEQCSVSVLTPELVRAYKSSVASSGEDDNSAAAQRARRSANSLLRQARSIFSRRMLDHYRDAGLALPDLRAFLDVPGFRNVGKTDYNPPDDALLAATFAALESLDATDRPAYLAVCLAVGAGMRRSEIAQARWSWFQVRAFPDGERAFLRSSYVTKNGSPLDVPVIAEWWHRLKRVRSELLAGGLADDAFVLPAATKTERVEDVFRRVSAWMRGLGWQTEKTIHEFRAYVGSKVAEKYGYEIASMFLRHGDVMTTKRFYLRYVKVGDINLDAFGAPLPAVTF